MYTFTKEVEKTRGKEIECPYCRKWSEKNKTKTCPFCKEKYKI